MKLLSIKLRSIVYLLCAFGLSSLALAQDLTLKQVKEREEKARQVVKQAQHNQQYIKNAGETPLSTMVALVDDINQNNFISTLKFVDFRFYGKSFSDSEKQQTFKKLVIVWSKHHSLDLTMLSDVPSGHLNDGLAVDLDLLGVIKTKKQDIPIYLQRVKTADGKYVWKISSNSVAKIPILWQEFGYPDFVEEIANYLPVFTLFDMQNWQLLGFIIIVIGSWIISTAIKQLLIKIVSYSVVYNSTMQRFIRVPLRFFLFLIFLQWGTSFLGLSLNARVWIDSGLLSYLASIFLTLGIIEFSFALYSSRAIQDKSVLALLKPMVSTFKIIMVIVIILNWFDDAGFNITAIITGLGIGSLAIALAAQKSLENVFGAFTLFFARPIKPGDMCKFGNTQGRVEEISLRSTKIRKLDRKVVYVPNSTIASMELENITEIDNRRYQKHFRIRLNTPTNILKELVETMRVLIDEHPNTIPLERYVRFENVEEDAFIIVVNTYVTTSSRVKYKEIEERLNFEILTIIDSKRVELAIPEYNVALNTHRKFNNT